MRAKAGPSTATIARSTTNAALLPPSALRQPRTLPTASTMVSASTHSTSEARKAARMEGAAWVQPMSIDVPRRMQYMLHVYYVLEYMLHLLRAGKTRTQDRE